MCNHKNINLPLLIMLLAVPFFFLVSCRAKTDEKTATASEYYTCSMHPQVHENHPGNCPVCQMELIKVQGGTSDISNVLSLSSEQMQLIGLKTDTVKTRLIGNEISVVGTVQPDQSKINNVSSWIGGRIEKLFVRNTGDQVNLNQPLYELYSEELLNTEENLIEASAQLQNNAQDKVYYRTIFEGSKNKLLLWGVSTQQIEALLKSGVAQKLITIYSRFEGIVTSLSVHEGDYVTEGGLIMQLTDLSNVWIVAQVYDTELQFVHDGMNAGIVLADGAALEGTVSFINPELVGNSRIAMIRIAVPNRDKRLQPGIQANVSLHVQQKETLAIPSTAILTDESGSSVWIQNSEGRFEYRMISKGISDRTFTEILSGLEEGEVIVTTGAYLLYSSYVFNKGENPMAGMEM